MKIDVEGHEIAVRNGGVTTVQENRPSLLVECEERHAQGRPRGFSVG